MPTPFRRRSIVILDLDGSARIVLCTATGEARACAHIDGEDVPRIKNIRWSITKQGYAEGYSGHATRYRLHRLILGLSDDNPLHVDHINGDRLDNRRANLRTATAGQNLQNRNRISAKSGVRGVWETPRGQWVARAGLNGRQQYIGIFATKAEAGRAAAAWRAEHMPFSSTDQQVS